LTGGSSAAGNGPPMLGTGDLRRRDGWVCAGSA
jgi:hypothetical protein